MWYNIIKVERQSNQKGDTMDTTLTGYNIKARVEKKDGTEGWVSTFNNYTEIDEYMKQYPEYKITSTERNEIWTLS